MDDKAELAAFAKQSATDGVDLYDLLGVDASTSRDDIHRAWRRKGLKYHPDKAGADYDATLYERFARARDVLVDDDARKIYDTGRAAAAQRRMQTEQMSAERRRFKDELEAAERAHSGSSSGGAAATGPTATTQTSGPGAGSVASERDMLREAGRRRAEERQRREQEAHDRARQREDERIAEIEQRLRDKEDKARRRAEKKAGPAAAVAAGGDATAAARSQPAPQQSDAWRKILKEDAAHAKAADGSSVPIQQRPLFAYTMDRLRTAGAAQRPADAPPFTAQWDDVDDADVRQFITRVPRFMDVSASRTADVPMDTAS